MVLYITRKFPPSVGGMQRFNEKLYARLKEVTPVALIAWGGSQAFLPVFLPYAFLKALWICMFRPISAIYVSDGLLSPLGFVLKVLTRRPVVCGIHGRDIAFELKIYQWIVPRALKRLDRVICVSSALKTECLKRGVPERILLVIPNGVGIADFETGSRDEGRAEIERRTGISLDDRKILLTVGRLVPKKGVDHFIGSILPLIVQEEPDVVYIVAGDGPQEETLRSLIRSKKLQKNVFLLGRISMAGDLLPSIYKAADVFVMPNVAVRNDMEGFGIVALEAGAAGCPVVASDVDGISEAVQNGENGLLVNPHSEQDFARSVLTLLRDNDRRQQCAKQARSFVREHYAWTVIAQRYCAQFEMIKQQQNG